MEADCFTQKVSPVDCNETTKKCLASQPIYLLICWNSRSLYPGSPAQSDGQHIIQIINTKSVKTIKNL